MWQEKNDKLYKKLEFNNFIEAMDFMQKAVGKIEKLSHHPEWKNVYNTLEIWLSTHDAGNKVTEKDRELAEELDKIYENYQKSGENTSSSGKMKLGEVKLYTDGGSRGNPGPSAIGYAVLSMEDETIHTHSKYIGLTTNNQAEYQGLREGLEYCIKQNIPTVHIYMDSLLVVNQIQGIYKVKNRDLWPVHEAIKELMGKFKKTTISHVPRELNKIADSMVNESLDKETK